MNAHAALSPMPALRINPELDLAALAAQFRAEGHVRLRRLFTEGAPELYYILENHPDWVQLINRDEGAHEIAWEAWREPDFRLRADIETEMFARARDGFQYSYAALRVPSAGEDCDDPVLCGLSAMMRGRPMLTLLEAITGLRDPVFTDGQVTAYGPGDFLTGHDDDLPGSGRKVAFVLGLTPQWRLEWGGLLLFHEVGGTDCHGFIPQFNTLDLFAIPRYHSVTMVTLAAARRRFSLTGWLSVPD